MGFDAYAHAIIGLEVDTDDLYSTREAPGCSCENIPLDAKFCPHCGNKSTKREQIPIDGHVEYESLRGHKLVSQGMDDDYMYVVMLDAETGSTNGGHLMEMTKLPMLSPEGGIPASCFENFVKDMKELGLWDPDRFGLWAVCEVSV